MTNASTSDGFLWWRDGVIYQIYPRSFADTTGSGLGDLTGITSRLDYLADLGIDAIWLSPFYPSPDKDFGYDISDHTAIDPRFGILADFDHLVQEAHRHGIRIVLDMVMNHTSDQHPWFRQSRSNRENPQRDWYIWRPPTSPGKVNNWQASFGGSAWEYDAASGEYYLHLFAREQPDVNWRNPDLRAAQLDVFRFWLSHDVDGFRLDVFNAYFKDSQFRNNPSRFGLRGFDRQRHIFDLDQPEMLPLLNELRALLDSYPQRYAVGETYLTSPEKAVAYCGADKLHGAFSFDFTPIELLIPWNPRWLMKQIQHLEAVFNPAGIWPTIVMSNHDLPRAASRYSRGEDDHMAKLAMALLLTLRGTPFLYYGEEIGMRDVTLSRSEIMDPLGKKYWPFYRGRDGYRSPMQWDNSPHAGFTTGRPWMKVHPNYTHRNVAAQRQDPDSIFNFTRALLSLRKRSPALSGGDFTPLENAPAGVLAYLRQTHDQFALVAINFSRQKQSLILPDQEWQVWLGEDAPKSGRLLLSPQSAHLLGTEPLSEPNSAFH